MTLHDVNRDDEPRRSPAGTPARPAVGTAPGAGGGGGGASGTGGSWGSVTACTNGPLLVRGDVEILLANGEPAPRRRATVALCRCGASGIKPYCDGTHKVIGFRTDDEPTE